MASYSSQSIRGFERIIGTSSFLRVAVAQAAKVASTDVPVLIVGESGTGKRLLAHTIHQSGRSATSPFLAINCAALSGPLLDDQLRTLEEALCAGSNKAKSVTGGTLLLDEVAELSPVIQARLLTLLKLPELRRFRGEPSPHAPPRILATTSGQPAKSLEIGLLHRLGGFFLHLPPLRQRRDDILPLGRYFLRTLAPRFGKREIGFAPDAEAALLEHDWPGNVRELQNRVQQALILADANVLTREDLAIYSLTYEPDTPIATIPTEPHRPSYSLPEVEARMIAGVLKTCQGNKSKAANLLGLSRSQLYTRLKRPMPPAQNSPRPART